MSKERPAQVPLSWVCVSEPCLRVSYTGLQQQIPGSSLPRSPCLQPLLHLIRILSQADVGAAGGNYRLLWLTLKLPPNCAPFTPSLADGPGGVLLQLGLVGASGLLGTGVCASLTAAPG